MISLGYMLNKQEQEKRAKYISGLYGKPLKRKVADNTASRQHRWAVSFFAGSLLLLPFLISSAVFGFYNNYPYTSLADVQAGSILFVIYFIGLVALFIIFLKITANELRRRYSTGRFIFLGTIFIMIPIYYWLHKLIVWHDPQEINEIVVRVSIYAVIAYFVTVAVIAGVTTFAAKRAAKSNN